MDQLPPGIGPDALTAHQVRLEALRRAAHDVPHETRIEAMLATIGADVTAAAQARLEQEKAAHAAPRPAPLPHPKPHEHWHGPFGMPWF